MVEHLFPTVIWILVELVDCYNLSFRPGYKPDARWFKYSARSSKAQTGFCGGRPLAMWLERAGALNFEMVTRNGGEI
jgi:hypothetical protein